MIEDGIFLERVLDEVQVEFAGRLRLLGGEGFLFELDEMPAQAVDPQVASGFGEVALVAVGDEFKDVPEVVDAVVDRRGGEEKICFPRPPSWWRYS